MPPPNCRLVLIGVHAGPVSMRSLNHAAQIQTSAPGATLIGKAISKIARVVLPSNLKSAGSVGAVAPTYENTAAPLTAAGFERLPSPAASWRRTFTLRPSTDTMSTAGAAP